MIRVLQDRNLLPWLPCHYCGRRGWGVLCTCGHSLCSISDIETDIFVCCLRWKGPGSWRPGGIYKAQFGDGSEMIRLYQTHTSRIRLLICIFQRSWRELFEVQFLKSRCHMWVSWNPQINQFGPTGLADFVSMSMANCKLGLYVTLQGQPWKRRSFHLRHGAKKFFNNLLILLDFDRFQNSQILHVELEPVRCSRWFICLFCTLGGAYSSGTCRCRWHPCRYHGGSSSMLSSPVKLTPNALWTGHLAEAVESSRHQDKFWDTGRCLRVGSSINICPLQNEIASLIIVFLKRLPTSTWRKLLTVSLRQAY